MKTFAAMILTAAFGLASTASFATDSAMEPSPVHHQKDQRKSQKPAKEAKEAKEQKAEQYAQSDTMAPDESVATDTMPAKKSHKKHSRKKEASKSAASMAH